MSGCLILEFTKKTTMREINMPFKLIECISFCCRRGVASSELSTSSGLCILTR